MVARASHIDVTLRVNPGADFTLWCSWHTDCSYTPPSSGTELDWDELPSHEVFWRSHGYRSDTPYQFSIAVGTIVRQIGTACETVHVNVVDAFNFQKGHIQYKHTNTYTHLWTIDIRGSSGWAYESYVVAFTVNPDKPGCHWLGEHLHQDGSPSFTSTRNPLYNNLGSYWVGLLQNWQYSQSWNW